MSKEEAKLYLRKKLPKLKLAAIFLLVAGILVAAGTILTGNYNIGTFLFCIGLIPAVLICIIYALVLGIRYDEMAETE